MNRNSAYSYSDILASCASAFVGTSAITHFAVPSAERFISFSDNCFVAFPLRASLERSARAIFLVFNGAPSDINLSTVSYSSFVIGSM